MHIIPSLIHVHSIISCFTMILNERLPDIKNNTSIHRKYQSQSPFLITRKYVRSQKFNGAN